MGREQIYLNDEEQKIIVQASVKSDSSVTEYIKNAAVEKAKKEIGEQYG